MNHSATDTSAASTVITEAMGTPNAFDHETPPMARVSTKMHHARSSR